MGPLVWFRSTTYDSENLLNKGYEIRTLSLKDNEIHVPWYKMHHTPIKLTLLVSPLFLSVPV